MNKVSPTSVIAASVAFAGALFLALPRPVDVGLWALGAVLGVGVSFFGFQAATRARGPLPSRSVARRLTLGSGATAAEATLGGALLGVLTILARH